MSANSIFFAPLRVPVTDPATGLMSRAWYLFFQAMFDRVGGSTGASNDDLEQLTNENADISDINGLATANLLSDAQADALDSTLIDPPSTDAADAMALLLDLDSITGAASPSAKVGVTAVAGSANTFMRSDAAPPIDQAIAPTWTGNHTFTPAAGVAIAINAPGASGAALTMTYQSVNVAASAYTTWQRTSTVVGTVGAVGTAGDLIHGSAAGDYTVAALTGNLLLSANTLVGFGIKLTSTNTTIAGPLGVSGNTPPAQVTGFGTPTGSAVVANYPGATATLVQTSNTVAEILTILKAVGFIGA